MNCDLTTYHLSFLLVLLVGCTSGGGPNAQATSPATVRKLTSPGDGHAVLNNFVGNWQHTVRWWLSPDAQPAKSNGTNINQWILGNRFLRQTVTGDANGEQFEGLGITGFDNLSGAYTSVWMDSLGTGMMSAKGTYDENSRSITEHGTFSDPITGESERPFRGVWTLRDADHYTYEMFVKNSEGEEFRAMQINYARVR